VGDGRFFPQFPISQCVLIKFPMNFHQVPNLFLNMFPITPLFIRYVLANVILMRRRAPHFFYFGLLHVSRLRVILDKGPKTISSVTNLKQIELWRITLKKTFFPKVQWVCWKAWGPIQGVQYQTMCLTCGRIRLTFGLFSLLHHGFKIYIFHFHFVHLGRAETALFLATTLWGSTKSTILSLELIKRERELVCSQQCLQYNS
jgi:hypothetical protein